MSSILSTVDRAERLEIIRAIETALPNEINIKLTESGITLLLEDDVNIVITKRSNPRKVSAQDKQPFQARKNKYVITILKDGKLFENEIEVYQLARLPPIVQKLYGKYNIFSPQLVGKKDYISQFPKFSQLNHSIKVVE
jgi:hypothetical protein